MAWQRFSWDHFCWSRDSVKLKGLGWPLPVWCLTPDGTETTATGWDEDFSYSLTFSPLILQWIFPVSSIITRVRLETWSRLKNRMRGEGFGRCSLSQISSSVQFSVVQSVPGSWGTAVPHMGTGARTGFMCQEHLGSAWILETLSHEVALCI